MSTISVYNTKGDKVGKANLDDEVFTEKVNKALLHQVVLMYLANKRIGSASTKTRGEVRGGGRKPWRQKGTGRARAGTIRSPLWRGGGVVFGPHPRNYSYTLPKKLRRQALGHSLSSKVKVDKFIVVDEFKVDEPKTKKFVSILSALKAQDKPLVLLKDLEPGLIRSSRNISGVMVKRVEDLNTYDVLSHSKIIITKEALERLMSIIKGEKETK